MIELKNISAGYGGKTVIEQISLALQKGRLVSVVGPNGAGKSTLIKCAAGIMTPMSGEIFAEGKAAADFSRTEYARRVAYLPQGRNLPEMTVQQLVLHGRFPYLSYPRRYTAGDRKIAAEAMKRMGISELAERTLSSLSGGERQKAYIAMALAQDTDCILLDEPTTYLDIGHQLGLMNTLRAVADSGKSVAAVLHDLELAFGFSDEVAVMAGGRLLMCDTPQNVCRAGILPQVFGVDMEWEENGRCRYKY